MKKIFYLLSIILASAVLLISVHNKPRQDIFEANIEALAATENTTGKRDCFWNVQKHNSWHIYYRSQLQWLSG